MNKYNLINKKETFEVLNKAKNWEEFELHETVEKFLKDELVVINHGIIGKTTENFEDFVKEYLDMNNLSICGTDLDNKIVYVTRLNFDVEVDNFNDENHVVRFADFANLVEDIHSNDVNVTLV